MAKRAADYQPPLGPLQTTILTWKRGREMHRVHNVVYPANQFNPTASGNARFSPIRDSGGSIIPTLYGGTTFDCALMETIFHDVTYKSGFKPVSRRKMVGEVHSVVIPSVDLRLVDLGTIALHKLGIDRAHLLDTAKVHYPRTRSWAQAIYNQEPAAHGLSWTSRRHDREQAVVLFGSRLNSAKLEIAGPPVPLIEDSIAILPVISLATPIGATLVD
jgi:RES domain